jgi:hypothetical protein
MPMPRAGKELNHLRAEFLIDGVDEFARLLTGNQAGGGIIHQDMRTQLLDVGYSSFDNGRPFGLQGHHRTAVDDVMFTDGHTQTGRFQRTRPLIVFLRFVTENGRPGQTAPVAAVVEADGEQPQFALSG